MLNKKMEVSDTQAVLGLLGVGSQIRSHNFECYGAKDATQYITREAYKASMLIETDADLLSDCGSNISTAGDDSSFCSLDDYQDDSFIDETDNYKDLFGDVPHAARHQDINSFLADTGIDPDSLGDYTSKAKLY